MRKAGQSRVKGVFEEKFQVLVLLLPLVIWRKKVEKKDRKVFFWIWECYDLKTKLNYWLSKFQCLGSFKKPTFNLFKLGPILISIIILKKFSTFLFWSEIILIYDLLCNHHENQKKVCLFTFSRLSFWSILPKIPFSHQDTLQLWWN